MTDPIRLDEFDVNEWWDVARECKPDITREEFQQLWDDYHKEKAKKRLQ